MAVEVDNRTSQHPDEDALAALVDRVLDAQGATDAEVAIILVDPEPMRALNREYRSKDEVTDVLAFPIDERDELPTGMPRLLGDVVICLDRCAEQAARAGQLARRRAGGAGRARRAAPARLRPRDRRRRDAGAAGRR